MALRRNDIKAAPAALGSGATERNVEQTAALQGYA
jgi:hypothetical protein